MGSNGPGVAGAAGNPPARPGSYSVAYLWEQIWRRDNWLEILQRYLHVQGSDKKGVKENPHTSPRVFPRYHQWDAVQKLVAHARANGAGRSYLIQHSAGSGKSNTIAWLSHRLSNLFDAGNQPVFHKVIVITDRVVLDRQLQRTIFQFDHTPGVVKKVDVDSTQLAEALDDATSKIVISTLQMYPFVLKKIADMNLAGQRYAVIIDEAHSSQGGESAIQLKQALGANATPREEDEDDAEYMTRVRGRQPNLSYFAFTATPKSPTLKLFGTFDPDRPNPRTGELGMYVPFHVYSMRQAIEEGYILDVLANYITYDTRWRLRNAAVEQAESRITNPEVDEAKAKAKLVRYAEQHPKSLEQKAKLIVDDFRENISERVGGRAKAMVVCTSGLHALHLYQAIRKYVSLRGFTDCGTLVAFSGSLRDRELEFTEAQLNVSLTAVGDRAVRGHAADGGGCREPEMKPLSEVIDELNERFGLDLGTADQILVYQQVVGLVEDTSMQQIALMNDEARFGQVADDRLDNIVAENAERNTDFMKLYFDNNEFQKAIKEAARRRAYRIIAEARDEALARLRAEMQRETGGHPAGE